MIGIITHLLIATIFVNSGYIPNIENKNIFLTHVAKSVLQGGALETELQPLDFLLISCSSDKERAEKFVAWLSVIIERYAKKIAQKEELPFMFTKSLVLSFFFDTHLYGMLSDWKLFTANFKKSPFDDVILQKIFDTVVIPYLQEEPSVPRLEFALKKVYDQQLSSPQFKEKFKAFFRKALLPLFCWRLKGHMEKMNKNMYLVARAEKLQGYILKQYFKERNQVQEPTDEVTEIA